MGTMETNAMTFLDNSEQEKIRNLLQTGGDILQFLRQNNIGVKWENNKWILTFGGIK